MSPVCLFYYAHLCFALSLHHSCSRIVCLSYYLDVNFIKFSSVSPRRWLSYTNIRPVVNCHGVPRFIWLYLIYFRICVWYVITVSLFSYVSRCCILQSLCYITCALNDVKGSHTALVQTRPTNSIMEFQLECYKYGVQCFVCRSPRCW